MQLEIYKYQSPEEQQLNDIRTVEIDSEIWFVGSDVASTLGYKNASKAISDHCKPKGITNSYPLQTKGGMQYLTLIGEPNLYRLISRSQLESAENFENWIFEEVLPSIRKKGYYGKIDRSQVPNFYLRYKDNLHKIDRNYFSVISELFVSLHAELERVGYEIPNKGENGQDMYPDISVGRTFSDYLKRIDSEFKDNFRTYNHSFPDKREDVEARMYPLEALPTFRKFIYDVWFPQYAQKYFKERDPLALDYLPKLLAKGE